MKRLTVASLTLLALALAVGLASAFVLIDPPVKWASGDLPRDIVINQNGHASVTDSDGGVTEIVNALTNNPDGWNAAVPGTLIRVSTGNPPVSTSDGISTMHFNVVGTGCSGSCLAVTFTPIPPATPVETVNGTDFRLLDDSDIFFNPSGKFYSSSEPDGCKREYHIESVAVHEVGHLLGLGHTPVGSATMYASTGACNNGGESLAQDDVDGINCIYNNGYGCGGCVPGTLIVDRTECSQPKNGRNKGDFVVQTWIVDNCGGAAAGALTRIEVVDPSGTTLFCEAETNSQGRLACALDNPAPGLYDSTVVNVSKAGFSWPGSECNDPSAPCECSININ